MTFNCPCSVHVDLALHRFLVELQDVLICNITTSALYEALHVHLNTGFTCSPQTAFAVLRALLQGMSAASSISELMTYTHE
jgi:hypothetical protein